MDFSKKTIKELKAICKEKNIKGISGKNKPELIKLLASKSTIEAPLENNFVQPNINIPLRQEIIHGDCLQILPTLEPDSAQIIIADPPYNIGKDFGNDSDKQPMEEYLNWCETWIKECLRILKPNGTMFIYGLPKDTEETCLASLNFAKKINSHYSQFNVFTPYPGTPIFEQYKKYIYANKFEDYSQSDLIFKHENLDEMQIKLLISKSYKSYYFRSAYILKKIKSIFK
jgi:DNA modification methylase